MKKKRERRRLKELNGANGEETPAIEEEGENHTDKALPLRKHQTQASRSMSPAVGRLVNGGHGSVSSALNGTRARSPPPLGGAGSTRDTFLNYFFGKDQGQELCSRVRYREHMVVLALMKGGGLFE